MAALNESEFIWMDGSFIPWKEANIHVLTHSLHYGNAVFEGVRAYKTAKGHAIFKLKEHTKRLFDSAKCCLLDIPFSQEELGQAHIDLINKNNFNDKVYIRPIVYFGYGNMGLSIEACKTNIAIAAWQWETYLGDEALKKGIKVKISSWIKNSPYCIMNKAKTSANYFSSQMANFEAKKAGYDEAILLDSTGFISEGSGECFFIVRDGEIITPPNDTSLESITQQTVIEIATNLGYKVSRRRITRDEAYISDEAFFTGTAAEVTPINSIDERIIGDGKRGPITEILQNQYFNVVMGKNNKYNSYLTFCK